MSMARYDPSQVFVTYGGVKLEGYGKDSFVEVVRNTPTYTTLAGAQGHAVAVKSADRTGYVQVTLLQTSMTNQMLSGMFNTSDLTPGGIAYPITVRDALGTTLCSCAAALIEKPADVRYGASHQERVWKFLCGVLLMNIGGN